MVCPDCKAEMYKQHIIIGGEAASTVWMCNCPVPHYLVHAARQDAEVAEQTPTNMPSAAAIQQAIDANVECVDTPNGKYLNRQQVMDCLNSLSGTSHVG